MYHNLISAHVFCTKTKKRTWISMSVSSIISLHGTFDNTNYFTFPVNAYSHGRNLILEDEYFAILRSKKKQKMETAEERKLRFLHLVNKHNFTRANLARHLGCSRAWVTKVLG